MVEASSRLGVVVAQIRVDAFVITLALHLLSLSLGNTDIAIDVIGFGEGVIMHEIMWRDNGTRQT